MDSLRLGMNKDGSTYSYCEKCGKKHVDIALHPAFCKGRKNEEGNNSNQNGQ